ncbi:MAG: AMP-binding protein [Paracoccaceae bacterium]
MQIHWPDQFTFIGKTRPEGEAVPAAQIAGRAANVADLLRANGCVPGDRIAMWVSEGENQLAAMFGSWLAGVSFCVLPSFAGRTNTERSQTRVDDVFSVLQPRLLLKTEGTELPENIAGQVPVVDLPGVAAAVPELDPNSLHFPMADDDIAFIQFTSGSTGGAKGAVVRFGQLLANLTAIADRVGMTDKDSMVSWAPLYHDMGLMAVLLPLSRGADVVLMETDHFVRRPAAWLEAISRHRGTVTTAPPTSLKLLTRRVAKDVDLSSWRYAWIGGEMVFPSILKGFEETYAPMGLAPGVLQPTYGMAETVVGISCGEPGEVWSEQDGFASCGPVLPGFQHRIVDDEGTPVAPGERGYLHVKGASVLRGYLGLDPFDPEDFFDTGDVAFEQDGRLYITGRVKDVLKRGGEMFPATVVEAVAEAALDLRTGRAAAFSHLRPDLGKEELVLLVESRQWDDMDARKVAGAIAQEVGVQMDIIRPAAGGRIPRTSSGKIMRQKAAALYKEGQI